MLGHRKEVKMLSHTPNLSVPKLLSCQKIWQVTPISNTYVSLKHSKFTKGRKAKIFSHTFRFLEAVLGYNISFTVQWKASKVVISQEETDLIHQEVRKMLGKGAISVAKNPECQFLSLFFWWKKDWGNSPVINLKELNKAVPYVYFKNVIIGKNATRIYVHFRYIRIFRFHR